MRATPGACKTAVAVDGEDGVSRRDATAQRRRSRRGPAVTDGRHVLGPCVGAVTSTSAKVWIYAEPKDGTSLTLWVSLSASAAAPSTLRVDLNEVGNYAGVAHFTGLTPACTYEYAFFLDAACTKPLPLGGGVERAHQRFATLPERGFDERLDFVVVSCNN